MWQKRNKCKIHIFIRSCLLQSNTFEQKRVWQDPSLVFLRDCLFAWVMPVVCCRQMESWVFNLNKSLKWELSKEKMNGFGRNLPTVLNKGGLHWGCHSECCSVCGGMWQGLQQPNSTFLKIVKSPFTPVRNVITPNSVKCFHTLPNNTNFHQRSPLVIPVSDGVMTGAS